jgi:hypothetical protein
MVSRLRRRSRDEREWRSRRLFRNLSPRLYQWRKEMLRCRSDEQPRRRFLSAHPVLTLGVWSFSGAWSLEFGALVHLNADAAFPCRTCRRNSACRCRKAAPQVSRWRQPWRRRRWKISSTISSNHSADISCLPSCWSGPGFRCPFRIYHNEIRKLAWRECTGRAACAQLSFAGGGANPELKAKHPTFNIEHPTSNDRPSAALWKFDVGRRMLDVPRVHWDGRGENSRKPSSRFDPPNSGAPPLPTCGHPLLHSKWRRGTGRGGARALWGKADQK